ncbi:MAG: exopolysaccharide biosynthesis polyprenyl glycosylphosphotransferase [Clostridia bacterium]|nr:exopolysaccharide biosynthesis polyprenyl glycosylphosphotransferase [Clostridia bacterium]
MIQPSSSHPLGEALSRWTAVLLLLIITAAAMYASSIIATVFGGESIYFQFVTTYLVYTTVLLVSVFMLDCFNFGGKRLHMLIYSAVISILIAGVATLAMPYFIIGRAVSKKLMLVHTIIMILVSPLWLHTAQSIYFSKCPPVKTVFITDMNTEYWIKNVVNHFSRRYQVVEIASPKDRQLESIIAKYPAVLMGTLVIEDKQRVLSLCASTNKSVLMRPDYTDIMMTKAQTEQCDDLLLLLVHSYGLTRSQRLIKRTFDLIVALAGLAVALPIILVCAAAVFISDGHNPFYLQERYTRGRKSFNVIKLRTMIPNAETLNGPKLAEKNDPRITKIGKFLRATRIDELPQLLNVLIGDMSIVGPRPERPHFYERIEEELPEFEQRLSVKCGITGYAQTLGRYSTNPRDKLMLDLMYIKHYSFALDIKLVLDTALVVFQRDSSAGVDTVRPYHDNPDEPTDE